MNYVHILGISYLHIVPHVNRW